MIASIICNLLSVTTKTWSWIICIGLVLSVSHGRAAAQALTPAERREMREEGYSPAEINEYNRELQREQQPYTPADRRQMRADGMTAREIAEQEREDRAQAKYDRKMDLLDRKYEEGKISDAQYEREARQIEKSAYTQTYGAILGAAMFKQDQEEGINSLYADWAPQTTIDHAQYVAGLQQELTQNGQLTPDQLQRFEQIKSASSSGQIGLDQARYSRDYVINGDKPLDAERGLRPKGNSLFPEKPQWLDEAGIVRLSKRIALEIVRDLAAIKDSLPEEASLASAQKLADRLRSAGKEAALVSNLVGALGDGDLKRLERNAELLGVDKQEIARMALSISIDSLSTKLEENAATDEIRRLCLQVQRYARTANLDEKSIKNAATWFSQLPDLLSLRETLDAIAKNKPSGEPAWPSGTVEVVLDPDWEVGQCRVLPNNALVCGARGVTKQIVRDRVDARVALGLPAMSTKAPPQANATATSSASGESKAFLTISGSSDLKGIARYNLRRYRNVGTNWVVDPQTESWPAYSIGAGRKQVLSISEDGVEGYVIEVLPEQEGGKARPFFLAKERGKNARYEIVPSKEGGLTVRPAVDKCFLDNSKNANPFHFMVGEEYKTVRPFSSEEFDVSVTLRYCPVSDGKAESAFVLKAGATGYVGLTADDQWLVSAAPEWVPFQPTFVGFTGAAAKARPKSEAELAVEAVSDVKRSLYVISVGVSKYQNSSLFPNLQAAERDAQAFAATMKAQTKLYEKVDVTMLLNESATAHGIRNALTALNSKVTKNDVVVIFLSGHGEMANGLWYFCPQDAGRRNNKIDPKKAIASSELQRVTSELLCKHAFVMLDSCFSGGATDGFKDLIARQGKSGIAIFASSSAQQESEEVGAGGAFTQSLLSSLSDAAADDNRNQFLEVVELDSAIAKRVRDLTNGRQHFQAEYSSASGGFKLVKLDEGG